jgi:5-methylcytosine-specific restriction endonuclease McrA
MRRVVRRNRRARMAGVGYKSLTFHLIAERDDWCCGICDEPVDRALDVPHPMAPTLDHIVPLAKGGKHIEANVQLAHFICNSRKGATTPTPGGAPDRDFQPGPERAAVARASGKTIGVV